jgi:hypothetical protein
LGLCAACAGLDGHNGVEVIVLAGEERLGFEFGDVGIRGGEFAVQLFQQIVFLLRVGLFQREIDVRLDVPGDGGEFFIRGDLLFGALAVTENALCGFLIAPEIGIGSPRFEGFQALAILRRVKDSSVRG